MVIVILGVLAAVALPKFVDLSAEAQQAATNGVAGSVSSASAINYAARKSNSNRGRPVTQCASATTLLEGGLPPNYSTGPAGFPLPINPDASVHCTIYGPKSTTATATMQGIL
jgi:MSHA pilin protein MshA